MNQEALQRLIAVDDSTLCEAPAGFDWQNAMDEVRSLKSEIEAIVDHPLVLDEGVQDASFFTDLSLRKQGAKSNNIDTVFAVPFSAFGRLFTVWSSCEPEDELPLSVIARVISVVERHGFHYISNEELRQPYTGDNPIFAGGVWWDRFFDYT